MLSKVLLVAGLAFFADISTPHKQYVWVKEAGTPDGATKAFPLTKTPAASAEVGVFLNGMYQAQVTDYTLKGNQVIFTVPPAKGDFVRFWYLGAL
jgi:hypothetical protein